jgi:uncharacterized membrane protein YedE/YeeE
MIMETVFSPWQSLAGGVLIGLSAVLLMAVAGRIMGATGILAGVIWPEGLSDWGWRAAVVAGMVSGPLLVLALTGQMPVIDVPISRGMLIAGGLIVGVGVTFGGGCTSGHGVCGMARLSTRSIVATGVFMVATAVTVFVLRHGIGG